MLKQSFLFLSIMTGMGLQAQNFRQINYLNKGIYFSVRPGVAYEYMTTKGYLADHLHFNKPRQTQLSLLMDWDADEFKGFMIRGEVSYKSMSFHGQGFADNKRFDTYELSGFILVPEVAFLFGSTRLRPLRVIGGIGLGLTGATVTRNDYTMKFEGAPPITNTTYFNAQGGDAIATITACLMYKRRWEFNCKYWPFVWYNGSDNTNHLNSHSISFALCCWW